MELNKSEGDCKIIKQKETFDTSMLLSTGLAQDKKSKGQKFVDTRRKNEEDGFKINNGGIEIPIWIVMIYEEKVG